MMAAGGGGGTGQAAQTDGAAAFVADLLRFSAASLGWCARESGEATQRVAGTLDYLITDSIRVANKSGATRIALDDLSRRVAGFAAGPRRDGATDEGPGDELGGLVGQLRQIMAEHRDVEELVSPLVEALQFQDFLQQALHNLGRMLAVWSALRSEATGAAAADPTELGRRLLAVTTTAAERSVVRRHIPGLPAEVDAGVNDLF